MTVSRTSVTFLPPVQEARRWLEGVTFSADKPLLNVSQAAPVAAPPEPMRLAMSEAVLHEAETHLYGPTLGLPDLRAEVASQWCAAYGGEIKAAEVAITSGCNQAFAAAISSICSEADEVILPTPWYFNHKMWLDMSGVRAVALPTGATLLPDPAEAEALISPRTRAIALVSPNNPAGVEYPSGLIRAFFELAKKHRIKLIIDETYRDFDSRSGAPHDLFADPSWPDTLIQLYSFSKAFRLTGHRVGAMIAAESQLLEVEKFLDTVTICPNQLGQRAALWGMQNLSQWLAGERAEILTRRAAIEANFAPLEAQGWQILGLGAYFAYLKHPFATPSEQFAKELVRSQGVLCLPGSMFRPTDDAAQIKAANGELRIAFANIDSAGIAELMKRLQNAHP